MSEKRFKKMDTIIDPFPIWDTVEEKGYNCTDTLDVLVDLLNEQQATIRKLQDLCGESDGENAKLRIENKRLQEEIERLQKKIDNISNSYEKFYGVKLKYAHWLQGDD